MSVGGNNTDSGNDVVTLQLPGRDLGDFLASLLGQRRTVSREFEYWFDINLNWILNLVEIINQRVQSQNGGKLLSLYTELNYENGKKVELYNLEQLRSYADVSKDISTGVIIKHTFLIHFPYKEVPERQDIAFIASSLGRPYRKSNADAANRLVREVIFPVFSDRSQMNLEIRHTDLSWSEDILNLVSNHVDASFRRRGGFLEIVRTSAIFIVPLFLVASVGCLAAFSEYTKKQSTKDYILNQKFIFEKTSNNLKTIEEKINTGYNFLKFVYMDASPLIYEFVSVGLLIIASVLAFALTRIGPESYVVLNQATEKNSAKKKRLKKITISTLFAGIILSIVTGLASSAIYERLPSLF